MATDILIQRSENKLNYSTTLDIKNYCELQSEQLTNQYPIVFVRIVYHNSLRQIHEEVINYAQTQQSISEYLAYLRSEAWLIDYPAAFTCNEVKLKDCSLFCYVCPIGYQNQKPEYIQIIAYKPLSLNLQNVVILSAIQLSKYTEMARENLRQKSEIKMLEEVLHRIGHQLRNSIASIALYAQNLSLQLKDHYFREQAIIIGESIQNLDQKLTDIINCGQGSKLTVTSQDLKSLIYESVESLKPLLEEKQLKVNISDTSTILLVDRLQIKQVFDNLLSNAVYFSPRLGRITCNWQIFQREVVIHICDQGSGLSDEDVKKIFTPFYSRRSGGTGLGLTIAKKIILDHQGSIWAQNSSKGGAEFSIILPKRNI